MTRCNVPGCELKEQSAGLCYKHAKQAKTDPAVAAHAVYKRRPRAAGEVGAMATKPEAATPRVAARNERICDIEIAVSFPDLASMVEAIRELTALGATVRVSVALGSTGGERA